VGQHPLLGRTAQQNRWTPTSSCSNPVSLSAQLTARSMQRSFKHALRIRCFTKNCIGQAYLEAKRLASAQLQSLHSAGAHKERCVR
jgi:hypothetical protein